ncbi:MAG: 3-deoxy-7-phosphoheptulonate synthase [Gaiellales bacterium]|nr:3-deoxy-7-phosphoheptulonate synthase [Gaiellales bacterium]
MMSAEARIGARADHRLPALQQPDWPDRTALRRVCEQLVDEAEPVDVWSCRALRDELSRAVSGDGFVVIGGDCAERFAETAPGWITAKAEQLHRAADVIETATGLPTTRIGRFGGQFAKPRSQDYEELSDGRRVLSYRGDAVNGLDVDERAYDPARLLTAHQCSRDAVRALAEWDLQRREAARQEGSRSSPRTYLGHEALLLDYERALLRHRGRHASSGHFLWIGDRTRDPDHAHVRFASGIENPVGMKLGPIVDPAEVRALTAMLSPEHERRPGRLSLIVRMGVAASATLLPQVIEALGRRARDVLWIVDPMHANQRTNDFGQKTRLMIDVEEEIRVVFAVLARHRLSPAGIHLEMTPDDVRECVEDADDLSQPLRDYRSACDPRLNPEQALRIADLVARLVRQSVPLRSNT